MTSIDDDPTGWFEPLYAAAARGELDVPWDRGGPHPLYERWLRGRDGRGRRALVVGSGLGGDAELTAGQGFDTVAFDISPTAVATVRARHPGSRAAYVVADVLDPPAAWTGAFDLVVEVFTVQSMPRSVRAAATANIAGFVAPGGTLVVVATRDSGSAPRYEGPPWPLSRADVEAFAAGGLTVVALEPSGDDDSPRWRAEFLREATLAPDEEPGQPLREP